MPFAAWSLTSKADWNALILMASTVTGCSTMDNIYKQESDPRYTGIDFRKVRLAFCRFSCQRTERWQIHCSKTHSPGRATSWQILLVRHRCSLANASGRVEFYTPAGATGTENCELLYICMWWCGSSLCTKTYTSTQKVMNAGSSFIL